MFVHGLGSNKDEYLGFYQLLAGKLANRGNASVRFDLPQHGSRIGEPTKLTLQNMVREIKGCLDYLEGNYPCAPRVLFGASFGAPAAIITAVLYPSLVSRLILLAPVADFDALYLNPVDPIRKNKYKGLVQRTLVEGNEFPVGESISFSPELIFEFATINIADLFSKLKCPIIVIHGTEDSLVPIGLSEQLVLFNDRADLVPFEDTEHGFTKVGDELGNDPITLENIKTILNVING